MYKFVFEFQDQDAETLTTMEIPLDITPAKAAEINEMTTNDNQFYMDVVSDIESDYGVHDWSTSGEEELIGYCSYEVPPEKYLELMGKWKDYLQSIGSNPGNIINHGPRSYEDG